MVGKNTDFNYYCRLIPNNLTEDLKNKYAEFKICKI